VRMIAVQCARLGNVWLRVCYATYGRCYAEGSLRSCCHLHSVMNAQTALTILKYGVSESYPRYICPVAGSGTMKVWKMQDLGLQTLQLVRTAANQGTVTTAMARFAQIVHNFPAFAGMVSSTKVSTAVREEVQSYTGEGVLL
jgi:hypothetical protein